MSIAKDYQHQFPPKENVEPTDRVLIYDKNNTIRLGDNDLLPQGVTGTYPLGEYNVTFVNGIATEITSIE